MKTQTQKHRGQCLLLNRDLANQASAKWFDPKHWPTAEPAAAGRGSTWFVQSPGGQAVLKHYRRGGLIARISARDYLFTGWSRVRALREFQLLAQLQGLEDLNVPCPMAAIGWRHGMFYRCALITRYIDHRDSLTELVRREQATPKIWQKTGHSLGLLARAGVFHVDLNPDNVLIDNSERIHIIDFDRAGRRPHDGSAQVQRLLRGLSKRLGGQLDSKALASIGEQLQQGIEQSQPDHKRT